MSTKYINNKYDLNLEKSVQDTSKFSSDLSLKDAVNEFRKDYILAVAKQTSTFDIYSMSRTLNYDRSELSRFVNKTAIKPQIEILKETYNPTEWYGRNPISTIDNIITRDVLSHSIMDNDYDIKKATARFKSAYITQKVNEYGIKDAASMLKVDERTIKNHLKEIIKDVRYNYDKFDYNTYNKLSSKDDYLNTFSNN